MPRRLSRQTKRRVGYACLGLLVILIGGPLLDRRRNVETIPDPRRQVADADNVLAGIVAAMPSGSPSQDPEAKTPSEMKAWLQTYEPLFASLEPVYLRPETAWARPSSKTLFSTTRFDWGGPVREWARTICRRGLTRIQSGQTEAGLADLDRVWETADRAAKGGGAMIDYLVAVAMEAIALRNLELALGSVHPGARGDPTVAWPTDGWDEPTKQLWRQQRDKLLAWHGEPEAVQQTLAVEHHVQSESYRDPASVGALAKFPNPFYLPSSTIRRSGRYVQAVMDSAALPAWQRDPAQLPEIAPHGADFLVNSAGKMLVSISAKVLTKVVVASDRRRTGVRLAATHIALKLHLEDHGRLPKDWAELVAGGYLPEVPQDPFGNAPLCYVPQEGKVYSVGENAVDDHGVRSSKTDDECHWLRFVVTKEQVEAMQAKAPEKLPTPEEWKAIGEAMKAKPPGESTPAAPTTTP